MSTNEYSNSVSDSILAALQGSQEKELKKKLLGNYTPQKRAMDVIDTCLFFIFFTIAFYNLLLHFRIMNTWISVIAFGLSMLFSDFCSGIIHWAADTWGTYDTPFFGKTFIRSFREHHVTPTAMCQHDIFETNGDNCLATLPVLVWMSFTNLIDPASGHVDRLAFFGMNFWVWSALFVALTNQIHSWAHVSHPPLPVTILQKMRIILAPQVHRKHHQMPFDRNYCITNGWMEPILNKIDFWRRVEDFISHHTGLVPREDDKKWTGISSEQPEAIINLQNKTQ